MLARFSLELDNVLSKATLSELDRELISRLKAIFDLAIKDVSEQSLIDSEDREARIQTYLQVTRGLSLTGSMLESVHLKGAVNGFRKILTAANKHLSASPVRLGDYLDIEEKLKSKSLFAILFAGVYHAELKMFSQPSMSDSEAVENYDSVVEKLKLQLDEVLIAMEMRCLGNERVRVINEYVPAPAPSQPAKEKLTGFLLFEEYAGAQQAKSAPDELEEPELSDDDDDFVIISSPKNTRKGK